MPIFDVFILISLVVNLSLNKTLLITLFYVRLPWMTQLILAISLWVAISFEFERILLLMHGPAIYVKEGLPFSLYLFLKNSTQRILIYVFKWLYFIPCLTSSSYIIHCPHLGTVFDTISSNIDEVLSINPFANLIYHPS